MALTLHFHPLSSFCMKVLVALYETGTPFEPQIVDFGNPESAAAFKRFWPIGRFPVLRDGAAGRTIPESSVIVEFLAHHYPGKTRLVPADPDQANKARLLDRVFDLYLNVPMQKVVTDRLRPAGKNDIYGVEQAKELIATAYGVVEDELRGKTWAVGEAFTMADCAAAPALFYANMVLPIADKHPATAAYLERLKQRPSFARVLSEAEPYFKLIPS